MSEQNSISELHTVSKLQEELLAAGYKKYVSRSYKLFNNTDTLFQKRIVDDKGTRYFINIYWYDWSDYEAAHPLKESIQAEVQFTLQDGKHLGVTSFYKDVAKIELQMDELWSKMGFGYCELNN